MSHPRTRAPTNILNYIQFAKLKSQKNDNTSRWHAHSVAGGGVRPKSHEPQSVCQNLRFCQIRKGHPIQSMFAVAILNHLPIDHVPKLVDRSGAVVAIINIVGVFPNINTEQGRQSVAQGVTCIRLGEDHKVAIFVLGQPDPTRSEERRGSLSQLHLHRIERSEIALDSCR